MTTVALKATITSAVAAEGTFSVPYRGQVAADFTAGSTTKLEVYARTFDDLAVTFGESAATVTWPAGAPYSLPVGEYWLEFDLVGGNALPRDVLQAENQADSTAGDVAGAVADLNALLAKLKTAGLMAPDA
jgi:hypothetical protein